MSLVRPVWSAVVFFCAAASLVSMACTSQPGDGSSGSASPALDAPSTLAAVTTEGNDIARTRSNVAESILTPATVASSRFGKLFSRAVDGDTFAQPLYVANVALASGTHNVVYVATTHDTVFAFDADDASASAPLWQTSLGTSTPFPTPYFGATTEVTGCGSYGYNEREVGVLSTPAIDLTTSTMYVVALVADDTHPTQYASCKDLSPTSPTYCQYAPCTGPEFRLELHALDITTGAERPNSPVVVQGTAPGVGVGSWALKLTFDPTLSLQRTAMLLANGRVYFATASYGDLGNYHGWIFAYDTATLTQAAAFVTTPDGEHGGIWQSGQGLAADASGYIYAITGNGTFDADKGGNDYGDSFLKLDRDLNVVDWFTPTLADLDGVDYFSEWDYDVGTSGPVLVPNTNLVMGAGKQGIIYVLNRDALGHFQGTVDNSLQTLRITWASTKTSCNDGINAIPVNSAPAVWTVPEAQSFYVWGGTDYLRSFHFENGLIPTTGATCFCGATGDTPADPVCAAADSESLETATGSMPGGILSLSANGSTPGTGIVWAARQYGAGKAYAQIVTGILEAFDARDVGTKLWDSRANPTDDFGNFAKFTPPTVANGKVYMATFSNQLVVYGLR